MVQSNGNSSNGSHSNGSHPAELSLHPAELPTSLGDFLSADEWRDLRSGLRDLAVLRAGNEAAAADIRI